MLDDYENRTFTTFEPELYDITFADFKKQIDNIIEDDKELDYDDFKISLKTEYGYYDDVSTSLEVSYYRKLYDWEIEKKLKAEEKKKKKAEQEKIRAKEEKKKAKLQEAEEEKKLYEKLKKKFEK